MGKFDRYLGRADDAPRKSEHRTDGERKVAGLPPGRWVDDGVYLIENSYRIGAPHGAEPLRSPDETQVMSELGATGRTVFLDLETTGLSGGAGTYAFLCGIGTVRGDDFVVSQFFLRGPADERAWLEAVDGAIAPDATLVTYNGATFDLPMLRVRHVLARMEVPWDGQPHVDALRIARRFYRGVLESCSLSSIEANVLGVEREGTDIPGALIPEIYARYLRTRDASPLAGVFYHNEIDIVSLAAAYCRFDRMLGGRASARELVRAAEMWDGVGRHDLFERYIAAACDDDPSCVDARLRMALIEKRRGGYASAREHFAFVLAEAKAGRRVSYDWANVFMLCEEIAKIDEHRLNDLDGAMQHVREAYAWLKRSRYRLGSSYGQMLAALKRRHDRIVRKSSAEKQDDIV